MNRFAMFNKFFKKLQGLYVIHVDPDGVQPIHALRTTFGAILAMILYRAFDWTQSYWIVFSTILILQTYNAPTSKYRWQLMIASGCFVTVLTFVSSLLCQSTLVFAGFMLVTTFITVYSRVLSDEIGVVALYINLFCLFSGALSVGLSEAIQRTVSVFLGFMIAILVCLFVFPENRWRTIIHILSENLSRLAEFNRVLSSHRYKNDTNEVLVSTRRDRLIRGFDTARKTIPVQETQSWQIILQTEHLYEVILVIHELKFLISQQKILRMVNKELSILSRRLTRVLQGFSRSLVTGRPLPSIKKFIHSLDSFEKYYSRHLQKFNQEQFLAFTVYISTINNLKKKINNLGRLIQQKGFTL